MHWPNSISPRSLIVIMCLSRDGQLNVKLGFCRFLKNSLENSARENEERNDLAKADIIEVVNVQPSGGAIRPSTQDSLWKERTCEY